MHLVTGATGNNGTLVTNALAGQGLDVRALVHSPDKAGQVEGPNVETVVADYDDPSTLPPAFEGVDAALFVVPSGPWNEEWKAHLTEAALDAGVDHVVNLSALPAAEDADGKILRWHAKADAAMDDAGLPVTHVRPLFYLQNFFAAAQTIQEQGAIYMPVGEGRIGGIDVRDVADCLVECLTGEGHVGNTYEITGPETFSMADAAGTFGDVLDRDVTYTDVPYDAAVEAFVELGFPEVVADAYVDLFDNVFKEGGGDTTTDGVQKLLGRAPRSLGDFVEDHRQAFGG